MPDLSDSARSSSSRAALDSPRFIRTVASPFSIPLFKHPLPAVMGSSIRLEGPNSTLCGYGQDFFTKERFGGGEFDTKGFGGGEGG